MGVFHPPPMHRYRSAVPVQAVVLLLYLEAAIGYPPTRMAREAVRNEHGMYALYDMPRSQCRAGQFMAADGSRGKALGALQLLLNTSACADGVGLHTKRQRQSAAAVSMGNASQLLSQAGSHKTNPSLSPLHCTHLVHAGSSSADGR